MLAMAKIMKPHIAVSKLTSMADEKIDILMKGLMAHQEVALMMEVQTDEGHLFSSWAKFKANSNGNVDLRRDASLEGSYKGIDQMGMFWSMKPNVANSKVYILLSINNDYVSKQCLYIKSLPSF